MIGPNALKKVDFLPNITDKNQLFFRILQEMNKIRRKIFENCLKIKLEIFCVHFLVRMG